MVLIQESYFNRQALYCMSHTSSSSQGSYFDAGNLLQVGRERKNNLFEVAGAGVCDRHDCLCLCPPAFFNVTYTSRELLGSSLSTAFLAVVHNCLKEQDAVAI
jgi:hypothetical protein